jgi:hypothetical protein
VCAPSSSPNVTLHISVESKSHSRAALIDIRTPGCFAHRFKSPARRLGVSDVSDDAIARHVATRATGDGRRASTTTTNRDESRRDATRRPRRRDDDDDDDDDARRER